jgi:Skp family chaperone for outer membrane proteins
MGSTVRNEVSFLPAERRASGAQDRGCRLSRFEENRTVKRTVIVAAALMGLGVAIYVGKSRAQNGGAAPAPAAAPQTKIALINLTHVIKHYEKFKAFQEEMKQEAAPFQAKEQSFTAEAEKLYKERNLATTTNERKDAIEHQLMDLKRKAEDNKAEGTKKLGKKTEVGVRTLYMDVYSVAERIAKSRGFEMVLQFNDLTDPQEYWSAQNIQRKIQTAPLTPMYYNAGLDISNDVVTTLNSSYKNAPQRPANR